MKRLVSKSICAILFVVFVPFIAHLPASAIEGNPPCPDGYIYVELTDTPQSRIDLITDMPAHRCDPPNTLPEIYIAIGIFAVAIIITLILIKVIKSKKE